MIYGKDDYEELVRNMLKRVPVLRTQQLNISLKKTFQGMTDAVASAILLSLQRQGYLLLTDDGWAITKGMYLKLTADKFFDETRDRGREMNKLGSVIHTYEIDGSDRIKTEASIDELMGQKMHDIVDCMWAAVDMMPDSEDFILSCPPFTVSFATPSDEDRDGKLFELIKINAGNEDATIRLLYDLPKIEDAEIKKIVNRVAIIENEAHAWKVPYLGFSAICCLDKNEECGFRIIEKRNSEESWKDDR